MHVYVWLLFYAKFEACSRPYGAHIKTALSVQASVSVCVSLYVCPSFCVFQYMYSNSRTTKHIIMKLNFGEFYNKKLPISLNFHFYFTILTTTLHEEADLRTFQHAWDFVSLTCTCAFLSLPCICTVRITLWKNRQVRKIKLHVIYFKFLRGGKKPEKSCFISCATIKIWF